MGGGILVAGLLGMPGVCFAATNVTVTSFQPGIGVTGCTLQEAVIALNGGATNGCTLSGSGEPKTAILGNGTYRISNRLAPTVTMTISGNSMGTTFIETNSGYTSSSAVLLDPTTSNPVTVNLRNLTLRRTSGSSVSGIRINATTSDPDPTVDLRKVRITGFNASGIYSTEGALYTEDTIIENNFSTADGGGVRFVGTVSHRSMRIFRSLVMNNDATGAGGGIYFFGNGASAIEHTTIAHNDANSGGGVFVNIGGSGYLEHNYSTIAENGAFTGGGIYSAMALNDSRARTYASIIAYNSGAGGWDIDGYVHSMYSLWSTTDEFDQVDHDVGDLVGVDPLLGGIKDLGGNLADLNGDGVIDGMLGYQPLTGSPAFDWVEPQVSNHPRDGRGFLRGQDAQGTGWGVAWDFDDIGAFEQGPWEAERITRHQLFGGTHTTIPTSGTDANLSDGKAMRFRATAINQFVTYRLPISETGLYALEIKVRKGPSGARARLQWSPNGSSGWTDVGGIQEFYTPSTTDTFVDVTTTLSPIGQVYFRWFITGKHGSSTNWDVVTDYIKLIKI